MKIILQTNFSSKPEAFEMLLYLVLYESLVEVILVFNFYL